MRTQPIRPEVLSLEERVVAGSYFGPPTGDGVTSPLTHLPGGTARLPLVQAAAPHHRTRTHSASDVVLTHSPHPHHHHAGTASASDGGAHRVNPVQSSSTIVAADPAGDSGISTDVMSLTSAANHNSTSNAGGGQAPAASPTGASLTASAMVAATGSGNTSPSSGVPINLSASVPQTTNSDSSFSVKLSQNLAVATGLSQTGSGTTNDTSGPTHGLNIPQAHARIWWTPARVAQAQAWLNQNSFVPSSDDVVDTAIMYVLTGNTTYAQTAINILMNFTISDAELQSVASDTYRWNDWVPVVYDWTYNAMTPDQRQTFMDRYNSYTSIIMQKSWGGPSMPTSNYFWGYFENEFNWAIATYYDNPMAQTFLDDAITTRWEGAFLPWAASAGVGGVQAEGSEYGPVMLSYPTVPLTVAADMGRDMYAETNFYKEAVYNQIYDTTPAATYGWGNTNAYYQAFPFGEDEANGGYPSFTNRTYLGDFMQTAEAEFGNTPTGQYAAHWLEMTQASQSSYISLGYQNSVSNQDLSTPDFSNLPLDYYAPGAQFLYTRNSWKPTATSVLFQLGETGGQHQNLDAGSFQIVRGNYWVSKETGGYNTAINGGQTEDTIAHNSLLYEGQGLARAWQVGAPQTLRLQSDPVFSYAAVDLSNAYRSTASNLDNPYEAHTIREFIFVKPLQTLVVLDRMQSSSDAIAANTVNKTFLLHFPSAPVQTGAHTFVGTNGNEALRLTNLLPGNATYNVVDEGNINGTEGTSTSYQYRLEETTTGQANSYFLNVLQARDANGGNVSVQMTQTATSWTITLNNTKLGHAVVVLNKGMTSKGGTVAYSATGTPAGATPLLDHVQGIQVTDDGPVWGS